MTTLKYPCCEHCVLDTIHDVELDDHEVPCGLCTREANASWPTHELQRLNAEVVALRASRDRFATLSSQDQDYAVKAISERDKALRTLAERDATIERVEAVCVTGTRVATDRMVSGSVVHVAAKDAIDTFAKAIRDALVGVA